MSCSAGVIDNLGNNRFIVAANKRIQRQTIPHKAAERHGRKELPFVLLEALGKKLLKEIAESLQIAGANNAVILEKLHNLDKNLAVLIEKLFVVYVLEREVIVRVEF